MTLRPLPVTVISGYLGAGKTSLVNHLLRNADGRRIMVMVNDFGELNIDADLLESETDDTITLSNGCICCTMGTELLYALGDAIDRRPRPDCLVIEASGVAQPEKIAAAAHAEPELRYCGIVSMADAANIAARIGDRMIGAQIADQLRVADLILVTKTDLAPLADATAAIRNISEAPVIEAPRGEAPVDLILDRPEADAPPAHDHDHHHDHDHAHDHGEMYRSWSTRGGTVDLGQLKALLKDPPPGLFRFKGRFRREDGGAVEAHLVGSTFETAPIADIEETRAVAIGFAPAFDPDDFARRWREVAR
ncbi:MAG: GTP-binding protein [Pseudomonadota bacterium]